VKRSILTKEQRRGQASEPAREGTAMLDATRKRCSKKLSSEQKVRFAARLGSREFDPHPNND
jgi:hypothetical protein